MNISMLKAVLSAKVYDVAVETNLDLAERLSKRLGQRVYLKREDLQPIFSFKLRGAANRLAHLTEQERAAGVIAASAGNHAQGVAMSAKRLGIHATIVMPQTTPQIKVDSVASFGATVVLFGDGYDDAYGHACELVKETGATFIHPFDDLQVIAGQGTVAAEIIRQHRGDLHAVFVPVGGGGLIAGVSAFIKSVCPEVKVIAVEPEDAASFKAAMDAGERVCLEQVGLFVDGVAVKQVGEKTFEFARRNVDDVVLVNTDEVCAAIKDIFEDTRTIVEPAGALAVAGIKRWMADQDSPIKGDLVAINSGANMNFDRLRHVAERADVGEYREILLGVTIPEERGSFLRFCGLLNNRRITEFNYRYAEGEIAHVFVGIETVDALQEGRELIAQLSEHGYPVENLTDNELAKLHIRYMVGGRGPADIDERIYRLRFPERPGALMDFLTGIGTRWNISLFHYRNHGADYGRVLMGIQIPEEDVPLFEDRVSSLGMYCEDETQNNAYRLFAGPKTRA